MGEWLAFSRYNPIKTIKTSFIGTMNMLGLAKRTKARFLLTSTSEVYGDPLVHPQARADAVLPLVARVEAGACNPPASTVSL